MIGAKQSLHAASLSVIRQALTSPRKERQVSRPGAVQAPDKRKSNANGALRFPHIRAAMDSRRA
ncbi:hypothetical protein [Bradyrhizobium viridifuturi]|uniref:hypothetical protein n=1 Tax=Bradyrhizobium viridifuturi TaxID=1654716 RepID=UPI000A74A725|nr:hypothetical protein [Bradyrhizobium viridifuturi]